MSNLDQETFKESAMSKPNTIENIGGLFTLFTSIYVSTILRIKSPFLFLYFIFIKPSNLYTLKSLIKVCLKMNTLEVEDMLTYLCKEKDPLISPCPVTTPEVYKVHSPLLNQELKGDFYLFRLTTSWGSEMAQ